jgi:RNA polymerase sigma-H factor
VESARSEERLFVEFDDKLDEEVVYEAKKGDCRAQEYLISKYENFVKAKAKSYFLIGADKEDIYQEGMIGLYKAIRDFKADKLTSFKAFAEICVTRQIITAIKTATRQKHIPLNTYISLNKPIYEEDSDRTLIDVLSELKITDPEELIIGKEQIKHIEGEMAKVLSDLEMEVLQSYLDGKSYQEIACDLDRQAKSIDNALQRVKRKLEKCLYYEK